MTSFFLFLSIFCAIISGTSFAANEDAYEGLIQKYTQTIRDQDDKAIQSSWEEINKVPEAQIYMEKKFPLVAYSFRKTGAKIKLAEILKQFLATYPNAQFLPPGYTAQAFKKFMKQTNADFVAATKNQNQLSNQEQVKLNNNSQAISNQNAVANSVNQTQRSNTDTMNDEVERMKVQNY